MKKTAMILFCLSGLALLTAGCSPGGSATATPGSPTAVEVISPTETAAPMTPLPDTSGPVNEPITLDTLKNFTYTLGIAPENEVPFQVPLLDGVYDEPSQDPNVRLHSQLVEPAAFGDLDGDLDGDAAALLATNTGGTGTFVDLVAVINDPEAPTQAGSLFLGDRVQVEDLRIENGLIVLSMVTHGPDDPACCPSQQVTRTYRLDGTQLVLAGEQAYP